VKVLTAKASPFGRKVCMAIIHCGLTDRIAQVSANPYDAADPLHGYNPLGKVPTLVLDDGTALAESAVIMQYLDVLSDGRLLPAEPVARIRELERQALADGVMDAGALIVMEKRLRPEDSRHQPWVEHQRGKIARTLAALATDLPAAERVQAGSLALAAALGFLDRRGQYPWRVAQPALVNWLERFRDACPAFDMTYLAPEPGWTSL
jgi:glutathione S-transferase